MGYGAGGPGLRWTDPEGDWNRSPDDQVGKDEQFVDRDHGRRAVDLEDNGHRPVRVHGPQRVGHHPDQDGVEEATGLHHIDRRRVDLVLFVSMSRRCGGTQPAQQGSQ